MSKYHIRNIICEKYQWIQPRLHNGAIIYSWYNIVVFLSYNNLSNIILIDIIPHNFCHLHLFPLWKVKYSPHHCEGFGLSDGEGMERLWSYLRRFSRMTKEMRPSHRIDILSDAIIYYHQKAVNNIGNHMHIKCTSQFFTFLVCSQLKPLN